MQLLKSGIEDPELVNKYVIPDALGHVWGWFTELSHARTAGFSGANPISFLEIEAWSRVTGTKLKPSEVFLLRQLDDVFLNVVNQRPAPTSKK